MKATSKLSFVVGSILSAAAVNVALAACTASSGGGDVADAGFIDALIDSLVGAQDARADSDAGVSVSVSGQLDVATAPCDKSYAVTGGIGYYAEHSYPGYTEAEIVARLRVVQQTAVPDPFPGYANPSFSGGKYFQVKANGDVAVQCSAGSVGAPASTDSIRFVFQK